MGTFFDVPRKMLAKAFQVCLFVVAFFISSQVLAYSEADLPAQEDKVPACSETIRLNGCPPVSEEFFEWFDPGMGIGASLFKCLKKSAKKAGYTGEVKSFSISHAGTYNIKKTNSPQRGPVWSLHSWGRAMDIKTVTVKGSAGNKRYNYRSFCQNQESETNKNTLFFDKLRQCWDVAQGSRPYGIGDYYASVTCEQVNHRSHMHLSFPFSPLWSWWNDVAME